MRILITEDQYRILMIEQKVGQVKITSKNYDQLRDIIGEYCKVLRLSKSDGDYIISKNRELYNTTLEKRLSELQESLKGIKLQGFKNDNPVVKNFVSSILNEDIKKGIMVEMSRYYTQLIYSYIGLNKPIDVNLIITNINNIMINGILKQYESSFVLKNLAKVFITKDNIALIKEKSAEAIEKLLLEIEDFVYMTFDDFINSNVISNYKREKEKSTPICDKVLILVDKNYNNIKPYSPRQGYKEFDYTLPITKKTNQLSTSYLPKINNVLDSLV